MGQFPSDTMRREFDGSGGEISWGSEAYLGLCFCPGGFANVVHVADLDSFSLSRPCRT